jgi:hypothetical protein
MAFDPDQIEHEVSIAAGSDDAAETSVDSGLTESINEALSGEAAEAHTVQVGSVG